MKKLAILGAMTAAGLSAGVASAATLDDVKARGKLNCGVTTGLVGFAAPNANGEWEGFDVGVCDLLAFSFEKHMYGLDQIIFLQRNE